MPDPSTPKFACELCQSTPATPVTMRGMGGILLVRRRGFSSRLCIDCLRQIAADWQAWRWYHAFHPLNLIGAILFTIVNALALGSARRALVRLGARPRPRARWFSAERFVGLRYLLRPRRSRKIVIAALAWGLLVVEAIVTFTQLAGRPRSPAEEIFFNSAALQIVPATIFFITFLILNWFSVLTTVSVVGVMLGVGSLIVVFSVTSGFQDSFRAKILGVNAHAIIMKYGLDFSEYRDVMKKAEADPDVVASAPFLFNEMLLASGRGSTGVLVKGIDPERSVRVLDIADRIKDCTVAELGFDAAPGDGGPPIPGIILGRDLAKTLRVKRGDRVRAVSPKADLDPRNAAATGPSAREFRVLGTFYSGFGEYDQKLAYVSLRDAQAFFPYGDVVMGVELRVRDIQNAQETSDRILKVLGGMPYHTLDWRELNRNLFAAVEMQRLLLLLVMAIITIVAAFNIVAALTMLVVQKTREIAIVQSLGLSPVGVGRVFLIAGMCIGFAGVVLGVIQGGIVCWLVSKYRYQLDAKVYLIDELPVNFNPLEVGAVALGTLALCYLASLIPARRASRLSPVEGLRYD